MKRTLPIASHPAAFASTLPPTSDNEMTIPSDISIFMTVLLFPGPVHEAHYTTSDGMQPKVRPGIRGGFENALSEILRHNCPISFLPAELWFALVSVGPILIRRLNVAVLGRHEKAGRTQT